MNDDGILRAELPPLQWRNTGDDHADFHYCSYLPPDSPLCVRCSTTTSRSSTPAPQS